MNGWPLGWCIALLLAIPGIPTAGWSADLSGSKGPLPARNYNPVQLLFLALPGEEADVLGAGRSHLRMEIAESSIIVSEGPPGTGLQAVLKFETFRFGIQYRYGIFDRFEAGAELSLLYRDKGFLDPLIISVEEAFAKLSPKRVQFTRGEFGGFFIRRDGDTLLSGERFDFGLGDLVLTGKYLIWRDSEGKDAASLRAGLKIPTGDEDLVFGSGKTDLGIGLAYQRRLHPAWTIYFNQNVVFPLGTFMDTGFTLNPISTTILAVEWIWTPRFSWLTQFDLYTSPFHATGLEVLDAGVFELAIGFDYALRPNVVWQLYGIENFNFPFIGAAADFTLLTNVSYLF